MWHRIKGMPHIWLSYLLIVFYFLFFFWYLVLGTLMYTIEESYITVINYLNRMIGAKILEKKMG